MKQNRIDLENQVAVVTGGAKGLGFGIAARLAASGAKIALWDMDEGALKKAREQLPGASIFNVDVTDYASITSALERVEKTLGPVSILVNSAGIAGPTHALADYPLAQWRRVIEVNLNGTFLVNRALVPGMQTRNYGRIVNIASIAGKEGNANASAYSASKAGVIGLTKSLGKELAGFDIAVNTITPAVANTPILEQVTEEFVEFMLSKIPRGRFLEINEVASMVAWLVSAENSFTTGAVFDLSGGRATY
ncbi:MAG TPA: SDR family oxidoreductase [Devosia sp.]|nr:SDR family oxidoreductase [Devosia sp.]